MSRIAGEEVSLFGGLALFVVCGYKKRRLLREMCLDGDFCLAVIDSVKMFICVVGWGMIR